MSTTYTITIGYNGDGREKENWDTLKQEGEKLRQDWRTIIDSLETLHNRPATQDEIYCAKTLIDNEQLAYRVVEPENEDDRGKIRLMASGGGVERKAKEETRRAFCRVLMRTMHQREININIHCT